MCSVYKASIGKLFKKKIENQSQNVDELTYTCDLKIYISFLCGHTPFSMLKYYSYEWVHWGGLPFYIIYFRKVSKIRRLNDSDQKFLYENNFLWKSSQIYCQNDQKKLE